MLNTTFCPCPSFSIEEVNAVINVLLSIRSTTGQAQNGLTMRTIEALGSFKKLVTTNREIMDYDFYSANNVCVMDRKNPRVPKSFFASDYSTIAQDTYYKYSLEGWLDEIFILSSVNN